MENNLQKDKSPSDRCPRCGYCGLITATARHSGDVFTFRCGCKYTLEKNLSKSIPEWSDRFNKNYSPDFIKKIEIKEKPISKSQFIESDDVEF